MTDERTEPEIPTYAEARRALFLRAYRHHDGDVKMIAETLQISLRCAYYWHELYISGVQLLQTDTDSDNRHLH